MADLDTRLADLAAHKEVIAGTFIRALFSADPDRFERFSLSLGPILFDYSKNRIDTRTMELLIRLAEAANVEARRAAMFAGEAINETEHRAVLHVALRSSLQSGYAVDGHDVMADIHGELARVAAFSDSVRTGTVKGSTGAPFKDVVNIGIGGSDLGPAMATRALRPYHDGPRLHFVSNMDGSDISDTLADLDPATTLIIVASKSFTTDETMTNARTARAWLAGALGETAVAEHFVALSTNNEAVDAFGIAADRRFGFWDWVGGRYSMWSAIGLPLCIAFGFEDFSEFLRGGESVDDHFRSAPLATNMPVIMALLGIWYRNFWMLPTHSVVPYDQRLARLPAYLQQLDMESNGKRTRLDGSPVTMDTGPVIWGEAGTNGQHAFFQLIHQGTFVVPIDFLIAARPHEALPEHHEKLVSNCLAQSEALMRGKTLEEVRDELRQSGTPEAEIDRLAPHRVMPGNRPSNTFLYDHLDPRTLGMLIALYEHKVFVQGVIWGINSFDQWGVEFGKKLARDLLPMVQEKQPVSGSDGSTSGLIKNFLEKRR